MPAEPGQTRVTAVAVCPICAGICPALDVVDFNKTCEEVRGLHLPLAGVAIYYYLCEDCGFCFAPEFGDWTLEDFEKKVYNEEYVRVDPDYVELRPRTLAGDLRTMLDQHALRIRHLDYGGGNGMLSALLFEKGWDSTSYDPFVNRDIVLGDLGTFDLITAFEVFEHVPDVNRLVTELSSLLHPEGLVLFSTLLSDGNIARGQRLTWWYASPRNGHVSLFSRKSAAALADQHGFYFGSLSSTLHAFWRTIPSWAKHLFLTK